MFKIMFGVALKTLVTVVFMAAIWNWYTGNLAKVIHKNLEKSQQVIANNRYSPILKNIGLSNQPAQREETIRQKSERAVIQARKETESFDAIYKRPDECYNMKEKATRIKCANNYMRARAAFDRTNNN